MRRIRVACIALATALVGALGLLSPVQASSTASVQATFNKVTAYFSQEYAVKTCGSKAFKILNAQYRFYRDTTDRGARVTRYTSGQGMGYTCAGMPDAGTGDGPHSHDACFGCNGNGPKWSRTYLYSYDWPYLRNADLAYSYSMMRFRVYLPYSGGRSYYSGSKCVEVVHWGGSQC